ncbi:microfibril-associated glycoprotein 4 [Oryzias melastigma]|uniref:Microfibril associated protein 4 n=1 Tax=Oryzias melastigma TaxID=30732 RepID=A0A3B3C6K5_ORYME|nr:microfibril-associated glycoprotein 4 [Oryzias melastigma]XP_024120785.1 microfibril-associated glycoprotein 4 [Oryzias melastigma]
MMKIPSVLLLLLAPMLASCFVRYLPEDCMDIHNQDKTLKSGVFTIYPSGSTSAVEVYCDMETDGGGWTVFQRRMDGSANFYRPWNEYKSGFGRASGEYWLGLENIYGMTRRGNHELRVDMEDFTKKRAYARYSSFSIDAECDGYTLHVSGFRNGGAKDAMTYHNGRKFSTFDKDQDTSGDNCAKSLLGAFWYANCDHTNPNGVYRWGYDNTIGAIGVEWGPWKGLNYSLKSMSFMIRPVK